MKRLKSLLLISSIILTIASCTKPEPVEAETPADWNEVAGTYLCVVTVYTVNTNGSLTQSGSPYLMSMTAERNTSDENIMEFRNSGSVVQYASNPRIKVMIVFDLPQQSFNDMGTVFTSQGYSYFTVGSSKYHGTYDRSSKELNMSFLVFHTSTTGPNTVHVITGTRQ